MQTARQWKSAMQITMQLPKSPPLPRSIANKSVMAARIRRGVTLSYKLRARARKPLLFLVTTSYPDDTPSVCCCGVNSEHCLLAASLPVF